jgi:UDP-N-acetylmuramyl pentapeptide phosphotransferase/UDP-N-acetylglucosamine-1-phosphate transferase
MDALAPCAGRLASAFVVSLALAAVFVGTRARRWALDTPNARSLHARPVPRTGGIAIVAGLMAGWLWPPATTEGALIACVLVLATLSFVDDVRSLPVWVRLVAHVALAAIAVTALAPGLPALLAIGVTLAIAWMINLYNFMDGSDGLAGGMAIAGFLFYGCAAALGGDATFACACWTVSATAAAFLVFNFNPARIFMGDAGSVPLGFLAGAFGLAGWSSGNWPLWFPPLVFSPFIVDATVTLARRLARREAVWQAHREHYYQRLVQLGWGHRATALAEYALMALCGIAALYALTLTPRGQSIVLGSMAMLYLLAMLMIDVAWRASPRELP